MKLVDGWIDTAQEYNLTANSWDRGGIKPTHIVLHGTAGGSDGQSIAKYMGDNGVSTNVVISRDGTIWQCVSFDRAAWGNGILDHPTLNFANGANPNLWTCNIEFAKPDTTNGIDITPEQFKSGVELVRLVCDTYGIPKRRGDGNSGIIGHCDIDSINRARCPGTFPWDSFIAAVANNGSSSASNGGGQQDMLELSDPMGQFFKAGSDGWIVKSSGVVLKGALLNYYRRILGAPRLPKANEVTIDGYTYQDCESGIMAYDARAKLDKSPTAYNYTYLIKLDSDLAKKILGLFALQQQVATLQTQIKQNTTDKAALSKQIAALQAEEAQLKAQIAQMQAVPLQQKVNELTASLDSTQKQLTAATTTIASVKALVNK